jgi:GT2 family glycosyltransferase
MVRTARVATSLRAELCVFDNGSTDSSVAVARSVPSAKVVANEANRGFAYGVNQLFAMTTASRLLLLNPDVDLVDGRTVSRLLRHFDDPRVGVVAPRLLNPDGSVQESARRFPTALGIARRLSPFHVALPGARPTVAADATSSDAPAAVDWAIGAALLIHRAAFDATHGWDQGFFLYLEDVDFCLRASSAGWRTIYDPTVELVHTHHRASHGTSLLGSKARRDHVRSMLRFFAKHRSLAPRPRATALGRRSVDS